MFNEEDGGEGMEIRKRRLLVIRKRGDRRRKECLKGRIV